MTARIGELARHSGIYGVGTMVGGLARIALVPVIARYVPAEEYGKASVILIFITLLSIVAELGFSHSLIRFVNEAPDSESRRTVISTVILASLIFFAPLALVCAVLARPLSGLLLGSPEYSGLVLIGVVGGVGNAALQVGLAFQRALARSLRYVAYTVVKGVLALGLSVTLVVALDRGAVGLLVGNAFPAALLGLVLYARLIRSAAAGISSRALRSIAAFGVPLVPMNLAMWVLAYSDIFLLRRLSAPGQALSEVGLYQYAHEICLILVLPITSLNLAWPQFIFANHSRPGAAEVFARVQTYFSFLLVGAAFLLSMFSDRLVAFVGSAEYAGSVPVIPILAGSLVFYGMVILFSSGLYISGRTGSLAGITAACAVLNIVLNVLLIPRLGRIGAAGATLVTNLTMALWVLRASRPIYRIPFRPVRSIAAVVLAGAILGLIEVTRLGSTADLALRILASVCYLLVLFPLFGVSRREIRTAFATLASMARPSGDRPPG
jgi:O-antigen/teichoic acid export membrane protein